MYQQPEIQGRKLCPDAEQCGNTKGAFEQLHPGQHRVCRAAQRLPHDGHTAGQQLSQTGGGTIQLHRYHALNTHQGSECFARPADSLPQQPPGQGAALGQAFAGADAAGHADGKVAAQQRLQPESDRLCDKTQHREQKAICSRSGVPLPASRQYAAIYRQKAQQIAFPPGHPGTQRGGKLVQFLPQ